MTALSLHPMRRKWTSCATAGAPSFSTELLGLESELIDYGILHEPLHLRVGDLAGLHGVLHEVGTVVLPTGPVSTYTGKIG
jgi:predicted metal-dependent hydrolase